MIKRGTRQVDWTQLHPDLLTHVLERLSLQSKLCVELTCKSWLQHLKHSQVLQALFLWLYVP